MEDRAWEKERQKEKKEMKKMKKARLEKITKQWASSLKIYSQRHFFLIWR